MGMIDAILSTVGFGLLIFSLLLWAMSGCCGASDKKGDHSFWGSVGWLCAVAGFILQIIAIWVY